MKQQERSFSQNGGGVWRLEAGMISFPQLVGNLSSSLPLEECSARGVRIIAVHDVVVVHTAS